MNRLSRLKATSALLQELLNNSKSIHSQEAINELNIFFKEIENMESYYPIGKVRLLRLFLETDLSADTELLNCYGRFANLIEGVDV